MSWKVLGIILWKIAKLCFKIALVFAQFTVQFMNGADKNANKYTPYKARQKRERGEISAAEFNEAFEPD